MKARDLRGAVAVVTGAGSGIGRALAVEFARHGAAVALSDVNLAGVEESAALARAAGAPAASAHQVDVGDADAVRAYADLVVAQHGRATVLVNNAGIAVHGTVEEVSLDAFARSMRVNFWGVLHGIKAFLPLLRREPWAAVVNISSVYGLIAPPDNAAYAASKFAVRGLSEALRHELVDTRVQVSTVHPGGVRTNVAANTQFESGFTPAERAEAVASFARVARTMPDRAAQIIVRGIRRGDVRILVGADARAIDRIQRMLPIGYWRLIGRMEARMAGRSQLIARRIEARRNGPAASPRNA